MKKRILALSAAALLALSVPCGIASVNANAYSLVNGEKVYSIAADRIIYQTDRAYDKSINTFEAWIKLPSNIADSVEGGVIMGNYCNPSQGPSGSTNFGVGANGNFELYWDFGGYEYTFESVDLRNDTWTHVALVRDKENSKITYYVNGEEEETVNVALGESVCDMKFAIGCDWCHWYYEKTPFFGEIRQVTVYSEAISQEMIQDDMQSVTITEESRPQSGLMGNWSFAGDWGAKEIIADDSSAGNDCTRITYDSYVPAVGLEDYDYSFVVVPDMQIMTHFKPQNFAQQSQWLVDNKETQKIQFVMYLGDMVELRYSQEPERSAKEWASVKKNMEILDGKVPYTFVPGNHDYDNWATSSRALTMFDAHMPYSKYSQASTFGGAFQEGTMANTYHLFQVGDVEYLIFCLEYGPRTTVLNWVDRITSEHPNSRVIVTSHSIVLPDGTLASGKAHSPSNTIKYDSANNGLQMWELVMSKHANMFMSFNGHSPSDSVLTRTDIGVHGNKVYNTLIDFQGAMMSSAMNTLLIVRVNERTKMMSFCSYSPEYDACFNSQNQYTFSFADENNPTVGLAEETGDATTEPIQKEAQPLADLSPIGVTAGVGGTAMCAAFLINKGGKKREE